MEQESVNSQGDSILEIARKRSAIKHEASVDHLPDRAGVPVFVDLRLEGKRVKTETGFVGCTKKKFIILETPKIDGRPAEVLNNERIVVRYVTEGKILGFHSEVVLNIGPPLNLTFVKFPASFEEVNLRRSPRISLVAPLTRQGNEQANDSLLNLSGLGAMLKLDGRISVGQRIEISFSLPNKKEIEDLGCKVLRRRADSETSYAVGVEFEPGQVELTEIEKYIRTVVSAEKMYANA